MTPSLCCLLLVLALSSPATPRRPSPDPPNLLVFRDPRHPSPLQLVVVHNATREVFVSGRNTLYHFDAGLRLKGKATTGPRLDHPACLHPSYPCNYTRTPTDDDARFLQVVDDEDEDPLLLSCGTLYQGACRVRPLGDVGGPRGAWVGPLNQTVGLVGSTEGATVGFEGTGGTLWSAATFDEGRPVVKAAVSSRILRQDEDGFRLEYSHDTDTEFTGIHFHAKYRRLYKVDYIHAFEHDGFAYFLQTQRVSIESESHETRLARVCTSDPTFFSYTELPLRCRYGLEAYSLATAAFTGPAGDSLGRRLKLKAGSAVLYASFVKAVPGHGPGVTDRARGSVLCSFPMALVVEAFTNATKECFRAEARTQLLKHVVGVEMPCRKEDGVKIDDGFCGSGLNHYIGGRESLPGGFRTHLDAHVTSLVVTLQRGKAIAVAGTDTGDIYKIQLEMSRQLYVRNIAEGEEEKMVRRSNAFDASRENVYFLVGNRVVKFPVGSCSLYRDCGTCLSSNDPLKCGWCGDHCAHRDECERPDAFNTSTCPPFIYEVSPLIGPTEGGTLVSIAGDNFGSSHFGEHVTLTVTVAGMPCNIILWEKERLQCKTSGVSNGAEMSGPVVVNVTDTSWIDGEFDQKGTAITQLNFTYVVPQLFGVYPGKGPVSGGTNVTLYGNRMDAGSSHTVTMAGVPCVVLSIQSEKGWCVTGNSTIPDEGPVLLLMDDAVIEVEASSVSLDDPIFRDFDFLPDPEILNIHPQATTLSGTVNVSVIGVHLDSVAQPEMLVMAAATLTGEKLEFHEPCWVQEPSRMTCRTPPLIGHPRLHAPTERAPLVTHVAFQMDGAPGPRDLPLHSPELAQLLYYPDPEYEPFPAGLVTILYDAAHLELKGRFLGLAESPSDILVTLGGGEHVCNVTSVEAERLLCLIPSEVAAQKNSTAFLVEVSSGDGRLKQQLGFVEFVERETSPVTIGVLTAAVLVACLIGALVYFYCRRVARRKRHPGYIVAYTAEQRQQQQSNGDACRGARRQDSNDYQDCRGRSLSRQTSAKEATSAKWQPEEAKHEEEVAGVDDETRHLLESENILIYRNELTLGEIIGVGHFGCVYRGELQRPGKEEKVEVAIKTLHNSSSSVAQDVESFLQEGLMMKDFQHPNVLTLVGVCFEEDAWKQPMVVIPYMKHGDLLAFIRDENNHPTVGKLLTFGVQIAAGMAYLAEMKFVHRDLAARNCMLSAEMEVKVADFGLSRDIYERDYYSSDNKKTKLPVKWMAPESLEKGTYSTKTDVWSFGVVLWELMTRGVSPYPDVDNWDIIHYLKSGRRMPQPSYCPDMLYEIMLSCWDESAKARPNFSKLEEQVQNVIDTLQGNAPQRQVGLNVTYINYPIQQGATT